MKKVLVLVVSLLMVSGCASSGNDKIRCETMDTVATKVVKGKTSKTDVKMLYGEPESVDLTDAGSEIWKYEYKHMEATAESYIPIVGLFVAGAEVNKNQIVFLFDKEDILQNYTVHASQIEARHGGSDVGEK